MEATTERQSLFNRDKLWIWLVMAIYTILLAMTIIRHEPWGDEAQAWLLARDSSFVDLFVKYLRYEGSPGLWHLILMLPAKLHFPYITLQIIAGLFAWFGVLVFLLYAPFPRYIKVLFPFGYFMLYQYAAVARVYTVFPLVLFWIATIYKDRMRRPYLFVGLLSLLSLLSVHGVVISLGILLTHLIEVVTQWKGFNSKERRSEVLSGLFYLILLLLIYWVLKVPKDYFNAGSGFIRFNVVEIFRLSILSLSDTLLSNILFKVGVTAKDIVLLLTALFFWYTSAKFAMGQKKILLMACSLGALLALLFGINYFSPWHTGLIFIVWVFNLWICADARRSQETVTDAAESGEWTQLVKLVHVMMVIVFIVQITWSLSALTFDWNASYSGALGVAKYIKTHHLEDKKIFTNFPRSMAIDGYFDHEILFNLHHPKRAFVVWTKKEFMKAITLEEIIKEQPELIIVKPYNVYGNYTTPNFLNYKFAGIYNGGLYWKDRIYLADTYIVYTRMWKLTNQKFSYDEVQTAIKILNLSSYDHDKNNCLQENKGKIIGSF